MPDRASPADREMLSAIAVLLAEVRRLRDRAETGRRLALAADVREKLETAPGPGDPRPWHESERQYAEALEEARDDLLTDAEYDADPWRPAVFCEVPLAEVGALMKHPCPFCGKNVMGWTGTRRQGFATLMHGDPDALVAAGWPMYARPI